MLSGAVACSVLHAHPRDGAGCFFTVREISPASSTSNVSLLGINRSTAAAALGGRSDYCAWLVSHPPYVLVA
jgi:hypothetical protein